MVPADFCRSFADFCHVGSFLPVGDSAREAGMTSTLATPPKKSVTSISSGFVMDSSVDMPGLEWIKVGL